MFQPPKNFDSTINTEDDFRTDPTTLSQVMKRKRCLMVGRPVAKLKDLMDGNHGEPKANKRYKLRNDQDQFYMYNDRPHRTSMNFYDDPSY